MFKAANKLQISQKYGPEQVKIAVAPQVDDLMGDGGLQGDETRSSPTADDEMHMEDHAGSSEDEGEGVEVGYPMEEEEEHRSNEDDGGDEEEGRATVEKSCIRTSGRSMSAKEGRVRFDIPGKRAQSAVPRLAGEGGRGGLRHHPAGFDSDALSMLSSMGRTNSDDDLADIPQSRQSFFDDSDFNGSPTPPNTNFSVSIMSKASTRQASLQGSRIGSGLSRFETDSPFSPMRLPFSPLAAPYPLTDRFLDEGGRGLLAMDRGSMADDINSISDVAPVNYNRTIPFSAPPEGRRARPNTAERKIQYLPLYE